MNRIARFVTSLLGPLLNKATRLMKFNDGLTVFLFHEVTDEPSEFLRSTGMWVSTSAFQQQVDWILKNFTVIPITDLLSEQELPRNSAIISFDDSWAGMFQAIKKYLLPREVSVCLFLNFGTIETRVDVVAAERFLTIQGVKTKFGVENLLKSIDLLPAAKYREFLEFQGPIIGDQALLEIALNPKVEISNHLFHHIDAISLSDEEFLNDFHKNQLWVQKFSDRGSGNFFAFPFGTPGLNFEERHLNLLYGQGIQYCFSGTSHRLKKFFPSQRLIPRIHFSPEDNSSGNMWWACYKNQFLRR
jgi:hypothetical protein